MNGKSFKILLNIFLISGSLFFIFIGLSRGKSFLVPLFTAIILAMVMAPVVARFRKWGINKGWAVFFADLIIVLFIGLMIFLLAAQANQVANNWDQIESRLKPKVEQAQNYFRNKLNMENSSGGQQGTPGGQQDQEQNKSNPQQQQERSMQQDSVKQQSQNEGSAQQQSQQADNGQQSFIPGIGQLQEGQGASSFSLSTQNIKKQLTGVIKNFFSVVTDLLLVLVYIFFFLYYSKKFRDTIIGMVPEDKRENTGTILSKISKTAQQYLFGRFLLIVILAVLYTIGWSILGLKYALFISILAALFSLIPYVGNVVGLFLAIGMSTLSGGGGAGEIIAIFIVFSIVQFVESYLLEPFVVGHEVDVNPVMVIVGIVLGGIVWGIMGMILAIPLLGILKVIFDNTESLRPLGYALDERDISSGGGKQEKVKKWVMDKVKKSGIKK